LNNHSSIETTAYFPDLIYANQRFQSQLALVCDDAGRIVQLTPTADIQNVNRLKDRALLPGLVNAHSHAFQRVIRARTEHRTPNAKDSFWTWREMMYSAATRLAPEDIYDASRMAFLEMVLGGITAVGEFHYIHHAANGTRYEDPNLLDKEVVRAANDVGIRIALLRVAYARSGFKVEANAQQARFIESDPQVYLQRFERLRADLKERKESAWVGIAPHSIRAVPLDYLKQIIQFGNEQELPIHMHIAEQPAEVSTCIEEYGRSPVALLETEGLLSQRFTGVHCIHITPKAVGMLARARASICACPTTERNLGDGVVPADAFTNEGVPISLGTDSHIQIDLLEDARELEYHIRLKKMERAVLAPNDGGSSALAVRLFECATINGANSIGAASAAIEPGRLADFFTIDLDDPSIAGTPPGDLLPNVVFSLSRAAIRDVFVGGRQIVADGKHSAQEEIVQRFSALQKRLWG
jgi:formimidoylglutamate deiminase